MSGDEAESDAGSAVSEGSRGSAVVFNADNDGVDADQDEDRVPDTYDGYTDAEYASIGWNAESRPTSTWKYEPKPGKYFPPEGGTNPEYLGLSPGELFMKIYGRPMDIWVYQTNLHAKHKYRLALRRAVADAALNGGPRRRVQAFRPITPREAKIWVLIYFAMGLANRRTIKSYWERLTKFDIPAFDKLMSYWRWSSIDRMSHFAESEDIDQRGGLARPDSPIYNPIARIRDYLREVMSSFRRARYPKTGFLAIDEKMIKMVANWGHRHHIPGKPNPDGIEFICCNESPTGYLLSCHLHTRSEHLRCWVREGAKPGTFWDQLVKHLLFHATRTPTMDDPGNHDYGDQDMILYADNRFMFLPLVRDLLKNHRIFCVGTVNGKRKYIPKDILQPGKNALARGESRFRFWEGSPPLQISCWQDLKLVVLISNHPEITDEMAEAERYDPKTREHINIPRPRCYENYSRFMIATDLHDKFVACGSHRHHRVHRWYKAVHYQALEWTLTNAAIIYREQLPTEKQRSKYRVTDFRIALVAYLLADVLNEKVQEEEGDEEEGDDEDEEEDDEEERAQAKEKIAEYERLPRCHRRFSDEHHWVVFSRVRGNCRRAHKCRVQTNLKCEVCDVYLCGSCFKPFHTENSMTVPWELEEGEDPPLSPMKRGAFECKHGMAPRKKNTKKTH